MPIEKAIEFLLARREGMELTSQVVTWLTRQPKGCEYLPGTPGATTATYVDIRYVFDDNKWTPDDVAHGMVGLVVLNPSRAAECLRAFIFSLHNNEVLPGWVYAHGVALGIFEAALWLQERWRAHDVIALLDRALPELLQKLVTSPGLDISAAAMAPWPRIEAWGQYEQRLGATIKKYTRDSEAGGLQGSRVVATYQFFDLMAQLDPRDELSPLARVVIEQMVYGEFGRLPLASRAKALSVWNADTMARITS